MIDFRLLKITLFNFACYYGENILDFTSKSDKNIFLFKLPNGYGKTSLFHAIKWGFYGEKIDYFKDSDKMNIKDFLNDRLDPKKDKFFVEIMFEYDKHNYELKRTFSPSSGAYSIMTLVRDGRAIKEEEAIDELNQIIPENFADFFMFDGEQLSRFMASQREFHFLQSIHQLLGLKQIEVLRDDLLVLHKRYDDKFLEQKTTNKEVSGKKELISGLVREITNFELQIKNHKEVIEQNEETLEKLKEKQSSYADLPKIANEIDKIAMKQEEITKEITTIKNNIERSSKYLFTIFIEQDLNNQITENDDRLKELIEICGLSDTEAEKQSSREDIIKKSIPKCDVCGHKLSDFEVETVKDELKKIKDSLGVFGENKEERDNIKNENTLFNSFLSELELNDFINMIDSLQENIFLYEQLETKRKELRKESQKEKYGSFSKISTEISSLEAENNTKLERISTLSQKVYLTNKNKEEITNEIIRLGHDDKATSRTNNVLALISKYIGLLNQTLDLGKISKREKILKKSNELFSQITNKPEEYGGIDFKDDESYEFIIKTNDARKVTNPSKGEKQVLAMSFLLGLNQYTGKNNIILMDTPVASLDDIHSASIGKALSNLNNQVIFLAQPQELSGDIYSNMKSSIAKEFKVERKGYKSEFKEVKI